MTSIWLLSGFCFVIAALVIVLPWLRTVPGLSRLPVLPWYAGATALLVMLALGGLFHSSNSGPRQEVSESTTARPAAGNAADTWADIANNMAGAAPAKSTDHNNAEPMSAAVVSLQKRLARGGGSAEDWELLAKSYEFLGRPTEAGKARAHQLPPLPEGDSSSAVASAQSAGAPKSSGTLHGEIALAPELAGNAAAGATLFIVAKSVDSPGPPVAVVRSTVASWPVKFDLTDANSMLPGRNLSTTHRVTVEARISPSGRAQPSPGDLQGATGVIESTSQDGLRIVIDRVLR